MPGPFLSKRKHRRGWVANSPVMDREPGRHPGGCLSPLLTSCFAPGRDPGELQGAQGVAGCDPELFLADEELVIKAEGLARASLCPEVPVASS